MSLSRSSLAGLFIASAAFAQIVPPDDDTVELEHYVISAHPLGRTQADLAQPTSVLQGRELSLRQTNSLGELLSGEPGVSSTYFGPGASRPVIRGLDSARVRILENGTGDMDASVTSPDHAVSLDPLLVDRVEVIRGPASLLYGGSAVGGAVNVITHRIHTTLPDAPVMGSAEIRAGSVNDEVSGGVVLEGAVGQLAWHLDGFRRTTGDIAIPGYAESAALRAEEAEEGHDDEAEAYGSVPNTAVESDGAAIGLSWIGAKGYVGASLSGFNTLYGVPAGAHEHEEEAGGEEHEEEGDVRIDMRQHRLESEGEYSPDNGSLLKTARFKFAHSDYRHQELEGDEIGTVFTNEGHEARLEFLHEAIGPVTGSIGLQFDRSDFEAVGEEAFVPPSRTDQLAAFIFEEAPVGPVTLQAGARAEDQSVDLKDGSLRSAGGTAVSASLGAVWNLNGTWTLSASITRTERMPNVQELFADGPHVGTSAYEIGDPDLDKEKSIGVDVSLRKRVGFVTGSLTAFVNSFDGYIFENPDGTEEDGLDVYRYEQTDARFYGLELETVFHLHQSDKHQFDLTVGGDLVRGRDTTNDSDLPRITPARLRTGLAWSFGPWAAGTELQWVDAQTHVAENETTTDGYALLSAYAGYRFKFSGIAYDLSVRGSNLTDEEARVHNSFLKDVAPLPGRNLSIALRASF